MFFKCLEDEIVLEVKEKTTLSGLFFDTYKEDNEGHIILAIEPISVAELDNRYMQQQGDHQAGTVSIGSSSESLSAGSIGSAGGSFGTRYDYTFRFDEAQMEQMWQQMAANIETSVRVTYDQDTKKEAYWDQLENWILKGYQTQAKSLAMQVARVEFMTKALTQQMEVSFNQNFQAWSGYFDKRLEDLMDTRLAMVVEEQVNLKIANQTQEIKNLVVQQIQTDIDQRIDCVVNLKIANQTQEIKNLVTRQIQTDIEQRIDSVVNLKIANQTQEINNLVV